MTTITINGQPVEATRIDELSATVLPSTDHVVPAMRDGVSVKLTVGQILGLLVPSIASKFSKEGDTVEGVIESLLADDEAGIGYRLKGKGRWGGDDADYGVVIALVYNTTGGNRQVFIGNETTGKGIRITGQNIAGYDYLTSATENFSFGSAAATGRITLNSTSDGLVLSRLTSTQRDGIVSPVKGMVIYNTDLDDLQVYDGAAWRPVLSVGSGQTYHDVTSSRSAATNYTNNTGRPMYLSVFSNAQSGNNLIDLLINGSIVQSCGAVSSRGNLAAVIPPGATYRVNITGSISIAGWWEVY